MRLIEQFVVLITIIPATQFFRSSITGLGGGLTDSLSSNALSMGAGVAMGAVSGFMSNKLNKNSKQAGQSINNGTLSEIGLKDVKSTQSSKGSSMKGSIPNADLKNFKSSKLNSAMNIAGKVGKGAKIAGKVAYKVGKAPVGAGIALGGVAIGNKGLTGAGAFTVTSGVSELSDSISEKTGKVSDVLKDKYRDTKADDNGFKYVQDLGDSDAYKYNSKMLKNSTGIEDMNDCNLGNKKGVAITLDGTMADENSSFKTDNKALQSQTKDVNNMVRAFKNNDTNAINTYKSYGIENCRVKNGKVVIGLNNTNSLGILGASKEAKGRNTIVRKTKLSDESMNFKIPKINNNNMKKTEPNIFADIS